jgi:diadenosine tetraphosphate (Ap4A) HIT family hydrolase
MLGNLVRQFHVHVVARFKDDPAWPGPVWGHERTPYETAALAALGRRLREALAGK